MKQLPDWFYADRLTPINLYGYPSFTSDRIYELHGYNEDVKKEYATDIQRFHDLKRKCMSLELDVRNEGSEPEWRKDFWDNKIVIECETEEGGKVFVGYADSVFSIGLCVNKHRHRREPYPYKRAA